MNEKDKPVNIPRHHLNIVNSLLHNLSNTISVNLFRQQKLQIPHLLTDKETNESLQKEPEITWEQVVCLKIIKTWVYFLETQNRPPKIVPLKLSTHCNDFYTQIASDETLKPSSDVNRSNSSLCFLGEWDLFNSGILNCLYMVHQKSFNQQKDFELFYWKEGEAIYLSNCIKLDLENLENQLIPSTITQKYSPYIEILFSFTKRIGADLALFKENNTNDGNGGGVFFKLSLISYISRNGVLGK